MTRMVATIVAGSLLVAVGLGVLALSVLAPWAREETVSGLVDRLRGGDVERRRDAAATLGLIRGPKAGLAARALIEAFQDREGSIRGQSARSIGRLAGLNPWLRDEVGPLSAMLADDEPRVRVSAAIGLRLAGLDPPGAFEAILEGLRGYDPALKAEAAALLAAGPISDSGRLRRLMVLADDPSEDVRRSVREAVTRPGLALAPEVGLPVLGAALRDGSTAVRQLAATILGRSVVRVPAVRDTLMLGLMDRDPTVRATAAAALGAFSEDVKARSALRSAMDDPELRVRATASASLAVGRRAARAETLAELARAFGDDRARSGLGREVETDPARAAPRLIEALHDPNPRVRAAAARGLGEVATESARDRGAVAALIVGLDDLDPSVRRACASTLARLGPAAALAAGPLRRATRDGDRGVSAHALVAVQAIEAGTRSR